MSPLFGTAATSAAIMICRRAGTLENNSGTGTETETLACNAGGGSGSGHSGGGNGVQGSPEGARYAALGGCWVTVEGGFGFGCGWGCLWWRWCWYIGGLWCWRGGDFVGCWTVGGLMGRWTCGGSGKYGGGNGKDGEGDEASFCLIRAAQIRRRRYRRARKMVARPRKRTAREEQVR